MSYIADIVTVMTEAKAVDLVNKLNADAIEAGDGDSYAVRKHSRGYVVICFDADGFEMGPL